MSDDGGKIKNKQQWQTIKNSSEHSCANQNKSIIPLGVKGPDILRHIGPQKQDQIYVSSKRITFNINTHVDCKEELHVPCQINQSGYVDFTWNKPGSKECYQE